MIEKIKRKFINLQFLSFALIGGFNTVGAVGIYMALVYVGFETVTSSVTGDVITMLFSYFLNMHFTYHKKPTIKSFITFPISYLPGIIIGAISTILFINALNAPEIFAKAFSLPITIPLNFIVMTIIVKLTTKE